jgi:chorismate mutase/prephenate dehydratase
MSRQAKPGKGKSSKRRMRATASAPAAAAGSRARIGAVPRDGAAPRGDLGSIRAQIDAIDARIHELLNERARFAQQVGVSKNASGKAVDFYRP